MQTLIVISLPFPILQLSYSRMCVKMGLKKPNAFNMTSLPKVLLILFLDVLCTAGSFFMGLWLRYEFCVEQLPETLTILAEAKNLKKTLLNGYAVSLDRQYEKETDASLKRITSLIEPIMIVVVGLLAGTVVISIFL